MVRIQENHMGNKRVFSENELRDMGERNLDAVIQAIEAGDLDRAKYLAERMHRECLAMHDALIDWITGLLSFVGRCYGDKALYDAHREGCRAWVEPLLEAFAGADTRRRAIILTKILRGHMMPLRIEEDEEKFTFFMDPCGSGGRQVLANKYDSPRNFLKIQDSQPLCFGRKDFPVYCAHHLFEELIPQELVGYPLFVTEPATNIGHEPCRIYLYKDPKEAPKRFEEKRRTK